MQVGQRKLQALVGSIISRNGRVGKTFLIPKILRISYKMKAKLPFLHKEKALPSLSIARYSLIRPHSCKQDSGKRLLSLIVNPVLTKRR